MREVANGSSEAPIGASAPREWHGAGSPAGGVVWLEEAVWMIVSRDKAAPQMLCQSSGHRPRDSREPSRFG
jgi:hypothetical protein